MNSKYLSLFVSFMSFCDCISICFVMCVPSNVCDFFFVLFGVDCIAGFIKSGLIILSF